MTVSYWCKNCKKDFDATGHKNKLRSGEEYFENNCSCGKKVVRYITEKMRDPYYAVSKKQRDTAVKMRKDFIQPGEEGFKTYYRKEWEKIEQASEEWERKEAIKKKEREAYYREKYYDINERQVARAALDAEEKLAYG